MTRTRTYPLIGRIRFATICDRCEQWIEIDERVELHNSLRDGVHARHLECAELAASKRVCDRCSHPLNSHHEGRCNVAGPDGVCDCGQPVIVDGEEVVGYVGFTSFADDVA